MTNKLVKKLIVKGSRSIKDSMRTIDYGGLGIALIVDRSEKLVGILTDGDVRRAIINGAKLSAPVSGIMKKRPVVIYNDKPSKRVEKLIPLDGSLKVPILSADGKVTDLALLTRKGTVTVKKTIIGDKRDFEFFKPVKRVLVIGGAGYLGSVLCRELLLRGYFVRVLDNLMYGEEGIRDLYKHKNFQFIKGDCRNIVDVSESVKNTDAVIHLAAIVGDPACAVNPEETLTINYLATKAIAEICKFNQINRFLFASTCSIYGASKDTKKRSVETSSPNPVSLYAETKLKSEEALRELSDENFSPTIFRFATLYGPSPRMRFDLAVNSMSADAFFSGKINVWGGSQYRPFIEVHDAAEACMKWLESGLALSSGQIYNVGSNTQNYPISKVGKIIRGVIGNTTLVENKNVKDKRNYNVCFDKISEHLNFTAKYSLRESAKNIKILLGGYKKNEFKNPKYNNYEYILSRHKEHAKTFLN
jgi:nucleoside-diphosphate-sugar epimerase